MLARIVRPNWGRLLGAALWVLALAAACTSRPQDALVGTWVADLEATRQSPEFQALPAEQRPVAEQGLAIFADARIDFTAEGRFAVVLPGMTEDGTYTVTKGDGETLVIHSTRSKDGKTKDIPAKARGDRLALTLFGNSPAYFKRK
jgi:hypothetical protein